MYIEVKNLGGKDRGLKFNQVALIEFTKKIHFSDDLKPNDASVTIAIFYCGLVGYSVWQNQPQDFTYQEVSDWIDEMIHDKRQSEINTICEAWGETHVWKDWLIDIQDKVRQITVEDNTKEPKAPLKKKK